MKSKRVCEPIRAAAQAAQKPCLCTPPYPSFSQQNVKVLGTAVSSMA